MRGEAWTSQTDSKLKGQLFREFCKAGKTTLGRDAAKMLGFEFDDLDEA